MDTSNAAPPPSVGADATLAALEVSPGELIPGFWGQRTSFAVALPHRTDAIQVTAKTSDPKATMRIKGEPATSGRPITLPAPVGRTPHRIEVTAEDGSTTKTYEVKTLRSEPGVNWEKVLDAAPFAARDSAGQAVFDGRMWVLGGYLPELVSDVWSSADGKAWARAGAIPGDAGVNIPATFVHAGRLWVTDNSGRLFASRDGAAWDLVNAKPPWAPRYAVGHATFRGRMWVMGGAGLNDVWSSENGVEWTRELEHAPWSPRQLFGNVAVHRDRLWVVGGGLSIYQPFKGYTDVWSSPDGKAWTKATDHAPWPGRIWSDCVVYRNRMWLLGGFRAQPTWQNFGDVWYSSDGADWTQLVTEDVWSPRHEVSPFVYEGALWVVAGNAWPLVNDVWRLKIDGLTFVTQPVLEEFVGAAYTYRARADFHASEGPLRYRLATGPAWLSLDEHTGVVRGTPGEKGDYPVTLEAFDVAGETARQSYVLSVIAMG